MVTECVHLSEPCAHARSNPCDGYVVGRAYEPPAQANGAFRTRADLRFCFTPMSLRSCSIAGEPATLSGWISKAEGPGYYR